MNKKEKLSWLENLALNVIKVGHMPRHIGFIMDGNRRYAIKNNQIKTDGHMHGFDKLAQTLEWCRQFGVNEVTVYAFSIENFKRSEDEVNALMSMAREKFTELLNEKDELKENGVCIRFFGSLHLCPKDVQSLMSKLVLETKNNNKAYFNVCIAYTSRQEISEAITEISNGVASGCITVDDIDETLLDKCLYTGRCPDPDLIVRTSGEIRFSDFLLWQSSFAVLAFVDVLWPTFSFWDFCCTIFCYQIHYKNVSKEKYNYLKYMEYLKNCDIEKNFYSCEEDTLEELKFQREKRIFDFLIALESKELEKINGRIESVQG